MKNLKVYKSAPLPFQGQKRNFIEQFKEALKEFKVKHKVDTIVDLFGGSGLLSHTAKRVYPDLRVIYNDFDDFSQRLNNVESTNSILSAIRPLLSGVPRESKLSKSQALLVLDIIKKEAEKSSFVDYITLSSSLMFSGKYATTFKELSASTLYNSVKKSGYEVSGYLEGLEIVKVDYKQLFEQYKGKKNVLFVIDPPYLSTDTQTYRSNKYWKLRDYLDVLKVLEADNYVFFTSDKSCLVELCEWFELNYRMQNPFAKSKMKTFEAHVSRNGRYTDLMYYKNYKRK